MRHASGRFRAGQRVRVVARGSGWAFGSLFQVIAGGTLRETRRKGDSVFSARHLPETTLFQSKLQQPFSC
jgi:hypothetical protein